MLWQTNTSHEIVHEENKKGGMMSGFYLLHRFYTVDEAKKKGR
jgi:hypothetical protein